MTPWNPHSWQRFPAQQQPAYDDPSELEAALARLRRLPPLVVPEEVERLRGLLADAASGRRFLLQGGDCAEQFKDCTPEAIEGKLRVLLQMSVVLAHGGRRPVVRIGRIAGQFAKPRSKPTETVQGRELPSYRGDLVNGLEASEAARRADPGRLLEAYFHASATLNHLRALAAGGFADLHHPERWELPGETGSVPAYRRTLDQVRESLDFLEALGGVQREALERIDFFTSHEALLLPYEEALTRWVGGASAYYNLGAHTLWIGERTRQLDGAHVEYLRGIRNPLGVKVGPSATPEHLADLLAKLDPDREPGRLTLITRFGAAKIQEALPPLLKAVQATGHPVLWSCDPMHGNGVSVQVGLSPEQEAEGHRAKGVAQRASRTMREVKTRDFGAILSELRQAFEIHRAHRSHLGGVHIELTGEPVTECTGGSENLSEADLAKAYETGCDPRLNGTQSLEMAFLIAEMMRG
ncbi:3-deoxy-7-phosphoheptulonate synthase class II [Geothrix sp. 21YS21S-4]|uniref:3-deoxy-7-phosphoheptulonate synthase class II n=1 Tax=Geothrix sp. 21YS21S-4 TaxID=3068889 RepID=UPI0027B915FB|nr:3-deoxy-7-phosphoheptulonate synthase class II [Geothrix sp. 21YS21S-4]